MLLNWLLCKKIGKVIGHHSCKSYSFQLDQNVYTVLPSKPAIRPGMVLVFKLFLLRGQVVVTDRVVAWGCFPIADHKFDVIEGQ